MKITTIFMLSIILSLALTSLLIPILQKRKIGQPIREEGNKAHYSKQGTPTMGGLAFSIIFLIMSFVFVEKNISNLIIAISVLGYGLIGFVDDYTKISEGRSLGLTELQKLILQFTLAFLIMFLVKKYTNIEYKVQELPFINKSLNLGLLAIPFISFIMVGTVNAVNFTDGLDGLLSSVSIPVFLAIYFISKEINDTVSELAIIFTGVLLGFLVLNANPARIFMGDTGSMAIGGGFSAMMIILNKPIFIVILGGIYLIEALSVILQVASFKMRDGKRIFLMTPIHHHFELKGYKEPQVVAKFMVASVILSLLTINILG